jgi:hypothetical protein
MADKGVFGTDILYAGLAVGAVYLIYKLSKPLSDTVGGIGASSVQTGQAIGNLATNIGNNAGGLIGTATGTLQTGIVDVGNIEHTALSGINTAVGSYSNAANNLIDAGENIVSAAASFVSNGVTSFLSGASNVIARNAVTEATSAGTAATTKAVTPTRTTSMVYKSPSAILSSVSPLPNLGAVTTPLNMSYLNQTGSKTSVSANKQVGIATSTAGQTATYKAGTSNFGNSGNVGLISVKSNVLASTKKKK